MSPRTKKQFEKIRKTTREKILFGALELFAKKGYHGTSISQIAQKTKMSKGLMYNYFASKQKLLDEIIQTGFNSITEMNVEVNNGVEPEDQLKNYVESVLDSLYSNFSYWQLYLALLVHPEVQKKYDKRIKAFRDEFTESLSSLFLNLGSNNPELDAFMLGTFFDGLALNFIAAEDTFPIKKIKDALLSKYIISSTRKKKK